MARWRKESLVFLLAACLLLGWSEAAAQWGLGLSGNLGTGFRYTRDEQGKTITWSTDRRDDYTAGLNGMILDPRLATFNLSGALSTSDASSNQKAAAQDSRLLAFSGNLSLLPGKPYPLDLRFSQSSFSSKTGTDLFGFGGTWRIFYGEWPSTVFTFDRVSIQSTGQTRAETAFTTSSMRLTKRLFGSDMDAEFGLQNFTDEIRNSSTLRHFGRFSDTTPWSAATTFRILGDYFLEEGTRSLGSSFSLINRPDPATSRTMSLSIRNLTGNEQGETNLDANGAMSQAFKPFDTLSVTPFTTALVSRRMTSGTQEDSTLLNWSAGTSLVSSYFRPVLASGDYGLGLSYTGEETQSNLGTTQQLHLGLQSVILEPYRIRGDYTFTLERTLTDRNRHLASLRADGPVMPSLTFRSYAELLNEDAQTSSTQATNISIKQTNLTFGSGLTYTGIQQLYFDLGANFQRMETDVTASWVTRWTANMSYQPRERLTLMGNGTIETDSANQLSRFEILGRVIYQFGQANVNLEYRYESRKIFQQEGQGHSINLRINRPFRFFF